MLTGGRGGGSGGQNLIKFEIRPPGNEINLTLSTTQPTEQHDNSREQSILEAAMEEAEMMAGNWKDADEVRAFEQAAIDKAFSTV